MVKKKKTLFDEVNKEIETRLQQDKQNAKEFIRKFLAFKNIGPLYIFFMFVRIFLPKVQTLK